MMSIRSLADFNTSPPGGAVTGSHRHSHRPGPQTPADTTSEGWGLLPGHQRGPTPDHIRGLSHGHGHGYWVIVCGAVWEMEVSWPSGAALRGVASSRPWL